MMNSMPSSWTRAVYINLIGGPLQLSISSGDVNIIAGPNGSGKSALLNQAYRAFGPGQAEFLPGHRQITFNNDNIDWMQMPADQLTTNMFANPEAHGRHKSVWSEDHFKLTIKNLLSQDIEFSGKIVEAVQSGNSVFLERIKSQRTPIQRLNDVFQVARLPIEIFLLNGSVRARREGNIYTVDRLSDGERAAMFLVSNILSRPQNSVVLIDEPEKHLNPSISGSLISAAVRARPDLGYFFATHDLPLIDWLEPKIIVHVRNSTVVSVMPEQRVFDITLMEREDGLTDELRSSVLGSRKAVLYVEGVESSFDKILYTLVYPGWNVVGSGGWEAAVQYVRTLKQNSRFVWLQSCALIDGDGRDEAEKAGFAAEGIFCLDHVSIENLLLERSVVAAMAPVVSGVFAGPSADQRVDNVRQLIPELISKQKERIVAKRVSWKANRQLSQRKVSTNDIIQGQTDIQGVNLTELMQDEVSKLAQEQGGDAFELLVRIPVKESDLPAKIANALGFASFGHYRQAVIKQIEERTGAGEIILSSLRSRLPVLPTI